MTNRIQFVNWRGKGVNRQAAIKLVSLVLGTSLILLSLVIILALSAAAYQSTAQAHDRQRADWLDTYLHVRMLSANSTSLMDGCRESQEIITHHYRNGVAYYRCEGR